MGSLLVHLPLIITMAVLALIVGSMIALTVRAGIAVHRSRRLTDAERTLWYFILVFVPVVGVIIWNAVDSRSGDTSDLS
ncbi:hypothetical protein [Cnuibacter physcomitrellae]|uniref:hypothetical protein n=1 Tax=Cnuibacter physcomitrellae TaxID=1619308 RepID=UPI0012F50CC3|nr:hypothetical protein [Cnuibacter physcomitrellae]